MVLAFFVVGLWFGWLVETYRRLRPKAQDESDSVTPKQIIAALAFVIVAGALVHSLLAAHLRIWDSPTIRIVNFITAPAHLWAAGAFVVGWLSYRQRKLIAAYLRSLLVKPPAWLTAGGALAIVAGLIVVVALIVLGPEFYSR